MNTKKNFPYIGIWLKVDEKNKIVRYQADPSWMKNANEEEQKIAFSKLTAVIAMYRSAGYEIIEIVEK